VPFIHNIVFLWGPLTQCGEENCVFHVEFAVAWTYVEDRIDKLEFIGSTCNL